MFDRVRGVNLSGWFILEPWVSHLADGKWPYGVILIRW